jgi:ATP-binding cassette, subfamily B, bacterial
MRSQGRESGLAQGPHPRRLGWDVLRLAVRPHRRIGALGLAAGVAWSAGKLAVPALVAHTIDTAVAGDRIGAVIGDSLLIAVVGAAGALAAALRRWWAQRLGFLVERDIRARLVRHAYRLHMGFHSEVASGVLVSRTSSDLLQIQQPFIMIPLLFSGLVMLLGAIVLLSAVSVPLMLVSLSPTALILVVSVRFTGRLGPQSQAVQQELAATSAEVGEVFTGMASIKGLGAEKTALAALQARTTRVFDTTMGLTRLRASYLPFFDFLPTIGLVGTLWYGSTLVEQGAISVGTLVQANAYILLLSNPLRTVGTTIAQLQRALVSATLIGEIVSVQPAITDPPHPVPLGVVRGEIRFENIALRYEGSSVLVLDGIDLVVAPGETVALAGATGSGKSTLASLVPRLNDPTSGRVLIDGVDVRQARLDDVRMASAVVFEDTLLFSGSIADNISFANPGVHRERIEDAAGVAGAADFIGVLDHGYETVVGERGIGLSGGQRQRVGIARALLADAPILILDSATSAVDAVKEIEILSALRSAKRRTTLLIAHRPSTLALADRVVLMDAGRIADIGTHAELLSRSALYRKVLAHDDATADEVDPSANNELVS